MSGLSALEHCSGRAWSVHHSSLSRSLISIGGRETKETTRPPAVVLWCACVGISVFAFPCSYMNRSDVFHRCLSGVRLCCRLLFFTLTYQLSIMSDDRQDRQDSSSDNRETNRKNGMSGSSVVCMATPENDHRGNDDNKTQREPCNRFGKHVYTVL